MIFDIRTIPPGHSVLSQTTGLEAFKEDLPVFREKIACTAEIDRTGPELYVHLRFTGTGELTCSRCLASFPYPVAGDVRLVIKEQRGKAGSPVEDETVDYYYDSGNTEIDLGFSIYEEIMTALPMKPLCRDQCTGIAVADTGQEKIEIDPRWEVLKKLKHGLQGQGDKQF